MPRPVLIALIGVDGSGKTTQAKELAGWLRHNGRRARYFENAGGIVWLGPRRYVALESTVRWVALGGAGWRWPGRWSGPG